MTQRGGTRGCLASCHLSKLPRSWRRTPRRPCTHWMTLTLRNPRCAWYRCIAGFSIALNSLRLQSFPYLALTAWKPPKRL